MSKPQDPQVWTRVPPEMRQRIREEAAVLYDGNESMLFRRAIVLFFELLDRQRRAVVADVIRVVTADEREAIAS
jgi:hypothetical protein